MAETRDLEMERYITSTREAPPSHYSLTLEPFSLFLDSKNEKFESDVFDGAGKKWRLSFYPNRQSGDGGHKYISLGLEIIDEDPFRRGWKVNFHCKMFVLDQKAVNYTVFEEKSSKPRTFYGIIRECIFDQLMTVEDLMDKTKGYIVKDKCVFGVEITVLGDAMRGESLILNKVPESKIFTWTILSLEDAGKENFSDEFEINGHKWKLFMYPEGDQKARKGYLSLFLCLANTNSIPLGRKVYVEYKLRIKHRLGTKHYEKEGHDSVSKEVTKVGFSDFIQLGEIYEESNGYLFNKSMTIQGEIKVLLSYNYLE
ncbi:hypothetical protein RJ639_017090 [Escallonia herrerae]|uniref:MATH domain-containing protein n=1 Tax=Escallonia herrerae TaxID=1293975 RepID=A0AA89AL39_9ASTE|nr:hypothetical protein RJ639_017090 [Escallonia herrerae]